MWDWSLFWKQLLERDAIRAAEATISAAIVGQLIGVTLGILLGAVGASRRRWPRRVVDAYVRVFRGTPLLLQILAFYIVPSEYGIQLPVFVAGALALGMNEAAYLSEVVRSGLMSVDRGQREAAQGALYRGPPEEVPRAEAPSPRAMDARRNRVARPGCCCDLLGTRLRLRREYGWRERVLSGRGVLRRRLSCLDVPQLAHVLHEGWGMACRSTRSTGRRA